MFPRLMVDALPWGGEWDLLTMTITGIPLFDFFFTLVIAFGLMAFLIGAIVRVLERS